jgi:hypothetical protein
MAAVLEVMVFDLAILVSTTHFHVSENIRKTPAWPSLIGYVGVLLFGVG